MDNREQLRRITELTEQIAGLPKGYLSKKTIGGKVYYYHQWSENGVKQSRYLHDSEIAPLADKIEKRKELQAQLRMLKSQKSRRNEATGMKCTFMHKRTPVAELELDDVTGFIQKIGSVYAPEHLPKLKHQSLPILEQMLETLRTIRDRRLLWSEDIVSLNKKISELSSQNQTLAFLKQNGLVDPDIFISKSNELTRQLRQAKLDKEELMAAEGDATAQRTRELIALLEDGPDFLDRPDTELCGALVAEIIVESNDTLRFRLHNGLELRESIERTVR